MTETHHRLLIAAREAAERLGTPAVVRLTDLDLRYGGPSAGAAGVDVRKWPPEGVAFHGFRLKPTKLKRATALEITVGPLFQSAQVALADLVAEVKQQELLMSPEVVPPVLRDLAAYGPAYVTDMEVELLYRNQDCYPEPMRLGIAMARAFMGQRWDR